MSKDVVEIDPVARRDVSVHLHSAERQECIDEAGHARGLLRHDREEALAGAGVLLGRALQRLDKAPQRGERRAQLVARIGDEVRPHLVDALHFGEIAQEHEDTAVAVGAAGQRGHGYGHAAPHRNPLRVGDGHRPARARRLADSVEKLGRTDDRGDMTSLAQKGEEPLRRRIAGQHLAGAIEQDDGIGQRLGHDMHGRNRARQGRG